MMSHILSVSMAAIHLCCHPRVRDEANGIAVSGLPGDRATDGSGSDGCQYESRPGDRQVLRHCRKISQRTGGVTAGCAPFLR